MLAIALFAAPARAMDAGDMDGAVSCASSTSCGYPTPYCSSTRHTCVECVSDRNCDAGFACDVASGVCHGCNVDADCSTALPYCDSAAHSCVECLSDANCGTAGEKCAQGSCGSCGDGICGRRERIQVGYFDPTDPVAAVRCPEDCASLCPSHDLKSELGNGLLTGTFEGEHQLFDDCGGNGPDLTVTWQAPHDGLFFFTSGMAAMSILEWVGDCSHIGMQVNCDSTAGPGEEEAFNFTKGDTVFLAFRPLRDPKASYSIGIFDKDPLCEGGLCEPPPGVTVPPVTKSDGGVTSAAAALCMDNARARGDDICAGTECACSHCPQDYDDCGVIPGCGAVSACMAEKACVGTDCYISGACRTPIDTYGGLSGPAFRAAAGLQSCSLSLKCSLPCSDGAAPAPGAGSTDSGAVDAGRICAPGRRVECPCEGGVGGTKTCAADGSGFQACLCGEPPLTPASSGGCDCRVGKGSANSPANTAVVVLGALIALSSRRRWSWARRPGRQGT
ncbi:MAG TPA: hypothetical protein VH062_37210 [Polyangiaceae bacterium]|jgi:hypothetical protein|nr:hypothetical protein [Polyangiaceae bacterium]